MDWASSSVRMSFREMTDLRKALAKHELCTSRSQKNSIGMRERERGREGDLRVEAPGASSGHEGGRRLRRCQGRRGSMGISHRIWQGNYG